MCLMTRAFVLRVGRVPGSFTGRVRFGGHDIKWNGYPVVGERSKDIKRLGHLSPCFIYQMG